MPPQRNDLDREIDRLESELKRLEAEYNMFFAGRAPRPPWELRGRVDVLVKKLDRQRIQNTAQRFRFITLQSRFMTFVDLWDRGQRAREEGRSGGIVRAAQGERQPKPTDMRVLYVAALHNPSDDRQKLDDLYESVSAARRDTGSPPVPFDRFAALVKQQISKLQAGGGEEVAFRVAVQDGKVTFTARSTRRLPDGSVSGGDS